MTTPAHTPETLLPCPFCGGEADTMFSARHKFARCVGCTEWMHLEDWNRRTIPGPESALRLARDFPMEDMLEIIERAIIEAKSSMHPDDVYFHGDDLRRKKWRDRLRRWSAVKEWVDQLAALAQKEPKENA